MVGVAGKSKGCSTCRKRKKGCDLARPSCGQCLGRGIVCGGYQRGLTIIQHKVPGDDRQRSPACKDALQHGDPYINDASFSTAVSWNETSPLPLTAYGGSPAISPELERSVYSMLMHQRRLPSSSLQLLPTSLNLTAWTTLHASLFNSFFLPRNRYVRRICTPFAHSAQWTEIAPLLLHNDRNLQLAYLAISCSRIGYDNEDDNLRASGKKLYGKALSEMQRSLVDPRRRYSAETLLACIVLGLYEVFEHQTPAPDQVNMSHHGWLSHSAGVECLLKARGPDGYTTDNAHPIFLHARLMIAIRACTTKSACFLSEPQWLVVPWRNHAKDALHKIFDVIVFLPNVIEAYDRLKTGTNLDSKRRRHESRLLLARCLELNEQLRRWYVQVCADAGGRPLWYTSPSNDPSYPFPYLFSFDDPHAANTLMFYWACCLVIHETLRLLEQILNGDAGDRQQAVTLPDDIDPGSNACNIAQSLLYMVHPEMRALGPNLALFPAGMALGFFATQVHLAMIGKGEQSRSLDSMVAGLITGQDQGINQPTTSVLMWFANVFKDLTSRGMPGGEFLSCLMRVVGKTGDHAFYGSVQEV